VTDVVRLLQDSREVGVIAWRRAGPKNPSVAGVSITSDVELRFSVLGLGQIPVARVRWKPPRLLPTEVNFARDPQSRI